MADAVVLDTDVWSLLYARTHGADLPHLTAWREALRGMVVTISMQTQAEVLFGALISHWGEDRMSRLRRRLHEFPVLPVTTAVVEAHAQLRAECRRLGHPLEQPVHQGDSWVAATATSYDLPLASMDGIYVGAPGLRLVGPSL